MAAKVCNFSDLIERVAASCLLHPLANARQDPQNIDDDEEEQHYEYKSEEEEEEEEEKRERGVENVREGKVVSVERVIELETIMSEVFEAFSAIKKAYVSLQGAHCPWDPERMRVADVAIVGEMRRVSMLRERWFRRRRIGGGCCGGGGGSGGGGGRGMVREVVAPYEAAVEDLKKEVKAREIEVENLKAKLKNVTSNLSSSKKGKPFRKVNYSSQAPQVVAAPAPELFEATMGLVKEASKSFTLMLLSLMRAAHWDIAAAVRSIEAASANGPESATIDTSSVVATHQAKYALESYILRKIFQGFDHETFYMDGSLSSLINPDQYRRDCYTQFNDMKAMDPVELLGILPTCNFGKFCCKKYLAMVHPKMEESLFGDLEQHRQVLSGNHPRSQFYGEFLRLAKTIWLLHLLAFSLDPAPCQFEASRGAEFHPQYMVSVVKLCGGKPPPGQIVGFPVSPGFKLGNGTVIKARVYLVSRS